MHKKRHGLPPLDLLRSFEAAARNLSFTKAGAELFLTQSAVSRQVQALEVALGRPLFQRQHRALLLTEAGQMLYHTAARMLSELREAVERISGASGGMVTVTTMVTFASLWLVPRLADFRRAHPDIDVRIAADNQIMDLERSRIDIAVRYIAPDQAPAGARSLFGETVLPVCAPSLLKDRARPLRTPSDLSRHVLLHDDPTGSPFLALPYLQWDVWLEAVGMPELKPAGALHFSHYDQMIQAAVEGQGVALGRLPLLARLIRDKRLVAPFELRQLAGRSPQSSRAYFVLATAGSAERPQVQRVLEWLMAEAQKEVPAAGSRMPSAH